MTGSCSGGPPWCTTSARSGSDRPVGETWEKRGPLSVAEGERMRTHPYLAERTLARAPALAPIGALAALHHERLDGSGYPRGLSGDAIGPAARVLAAADVYHALTEERPLSPSPDYSRGRA
jgi:HD-GYP domain-containing protein (c-di-GMP phosphodiesterase class II)